jgi:hypothetical protein
MADIIVAPVNDLSKSRTVSEESWKHWGKVAGSPDLRQSGNTQWKVVTPQEVTKATQRIPIVPPEVVAMTTPIVDPVADPVEEKNVMGKPRKK